MNLTDGNYWAEYWKHFVPFEVNNNILFSDILLKFPDEELNYLEIGGFPATYSIFLRKFKNYQVTLLDIIDDHQTLEAMLLLNKLKMTDLNVIKTDIFSYQTELKYDVVMSAGFIEHFSDTSLIIKKHLDLLREEGIFLITLPNLKGLLGLITWLFDRKSYNMHNIACMRIPLLKRIMHQQQLKECRVEYYGNPYLYVNKNVRLNKYVRRIIQILSSLLCTVLPRLSLHKNLIFSPNIIIVGKK